MQTEFLIIYDR